MTSEMTSPDSHMEDTSEQKFSSVRCEMCMKREAKYRCPNCNKRTCSLPCVLRHKKEQQCRGERVKTAYIAVKDFTDSHLLSDLRFLEESARKADIAKKESLVKDKGQPTRLKILSTYARQQGVQLCLMPAGLSRHKQNTSMYHFQSKTIQWRVEWCLPQENLTFVDASFPEAGIIQEGVEMQVQRMLNPEQTLPSLTQSPTQQYNTGSSLLPAKDHIDSQPHKNSIDHPDSELSQTHKNNTDIAHSPMSPSHKIDLDHPDSKLSQSHNGTDIPDPQLSQSHNGTDIPDPQLSQSHNGTDIPDPQLSQSCKIDTDTPGSQFAQSHKIDTDTPDSQLAQSHKIDTDTPDSQFAQSHKIDTDTPDSQLSQSHKIDTDTPDSQLSQSHKIDTDTPDSQLAQSQITESPTPASQTPMSVESQSHALEPLPTTAPQSGTTPSFQASEAKTSHSQEPESSLSQEEVADDGTANLTAALACPTTGGGGAVVMAACPDLRAYTAEGGRQYRVFLKVYGLEANKEKYYELDKTLSVMKNLQGKRVIEFPTLHIVPSHATDSYAAITADEERNLKPLPSTASHPYNQRQNHRFRGNRRRGRQGPRRQYKDEDTYNPNSHVFKP